jgi:hypothetical protein
MALNVKALALISVNSQPPHTHELRDVQIYFRRFLSCVNLHI